MARIAFAWLLSLLKSEGQEADRDRMVSLPFPTSIRDLLNNWSVIPAEFSDLISFCHIGGGRNIVTDLGSFQSCRWSEVEMRIKPTFPSSCRGDNEMNLVEYIIQISTKYIFGI